MSAMSEQSQSGNQFLTDGQSGIPTSERGVDGMATDERIKLIERLVQEAIEDPSPMVGNLKASGGDLLEMALHLKPQIAAAISSCTNIDDLKDLQPYLETFVKLGRQADRLLRLGQEISRADSEVSVKKRTR